MNHKQRTILLVVLAVSAIAGAFFFPPMAQDPEYHSLADSRVIAGIPNFFDVASNVPFLLAGVLGLWQLVQMKEDRSRLVLSQEVFPLAVAFAGTILIFAGSAYYHWNPSNETLVWDRLPMTLVFMAVFSMILAERINVKLGVALLVPLLIAGVASVVYWHVTEQAGQGDLRPYGLVQFLPILLIPLILLLFPARYSGTRYLWELTGWYGVAKVLEFLDTTIWNWTGGLVAGHSLKHCVAALAIYSLVRYIKYRRAVMIESVGVSP